MLYVVYIFYINIECVHYIQQGEVIPYWNTTIQYINTLINIEYVHYIQHGEDIPYRNTTIMYLCIV
jgi:hypothetical protein